MTANTPRTKRLLYDVRHNIYPYAVRNDYGEPDMTDRQCPDKQHQLPVKGPSPQLRRQTLDRLHNLNHLTSITGEYTSVIWRCTSECKKGYNACWGLRTRSIASLVEEGSMASLGVESVDTARFSLSSAFQQ